MKPYYCKWELTTPAFYKSNNKCHDWLNKKKTLRTNKTKYIYRTNFSINKTEKPTFHDSYVNQKKEKSKKAKQTKPELISLRDDSNHATRQSRLAAEPSRRCAAAAARQASLRSDKILACTCCCQQP